jgi:vanillate O-demethylase ferredoxin subunit
LAEDVGLSVFLAGGIGVTPFVPMIARLNDVGRRWRLHYSVRTRDRAALRGELERLARQGLGDVLMNFDQEPGGQMLDMRALVTEAGAGAHLYCCGPVGMLEAFRAACVAAGLESARVHFEYFKSDVQADSAGGFDLILVRSQKTVRVKAGQTILQAVLSAGVEVPFSCEEGVCGACETRVLAGQPEHRDLILSDAEKEAGRTMMICCSGCKGPSLTLDI